MSTRIVDLVKILCVRAYFNIQLEDQKVTKHSTLLMLMLMCCRREDGIIIKRNYLDNFLRLVIAFFFQKYTQHYLETTERKHRRDSFQNVLSYYY